MARKDGRDLLASSEIMQELHKKAQEKDVGCLNVTNIAKKTGLHYRWDGEVIPVGGYFPRGEVKKGGIKECLIRWRWIDGDIDDVRREMRQLENRFSDPAITKYIERMEQRGGSLPEGVEKLIVEREKLEGQFMDELAFLLDTRNRIHEFLGKVDEVDREILTLRFLKGKDWPEIGERTGRHPFRLCASINKVLRHYDETGEYIEKKRYRKRAMRKDLLK